MRRKNEENYAVRFSLTIKKQFFIFSRLLEREKFYDEEIAVSQ
jgi:hypothetical protein